MRLVNARHQQPRWCLPPPLLEHIDRRLEAISSQIGPRERLDLEHHAHLVRAGQAPPQALLARLHALGAEDSPPPARDHTGSPAEPSHAPNDPGTPESAPSASGAAAP